MHAGWNSKEDHEKGRRGFKGGREGESKAIMKYDWYESRQGALQGKERDQQKELGLWYSCSWSPCWCLWPVSPQGSIGTVRDDIRRPCWRVPTFHWSRESCPCPWLETPARVLPCPHHHRRARACTLERWPHPLPQAREGNPDAMGIGKQDLPPRLKRVTPVVQNGQLSYHLGPQPGLTLAHPNIYTI